MHPLTVYTKTAKGVLETRSKTGRLSRELNRVFLMVDGKSTVSEMFAKDGGLEESKLQDALAKELAASLREALPEKDRVTFT